MNTKSSHITQTQTFKVIAPAKVNLFLAVGPFDAATKKHPVLNIMHTLILHDTLFFEVAKADKFQVNVEFLQSDDLDIEVPEVDLSDNLVYRAIVGLAEELNYHQPIKISAFVEKNIPHGAGLAGGSTDGAAALVAAAKIMGVEKTDKRVLKIAQELGSDVAFFLQGGCGLYKGTGEIFDHKISPINREIVITKPIQSTLSTAKVYAEFDKAANAGLNCVADINALNEAASQIMHADGLPMFNSLTIAAESLEPELARIRQILSDACGEKNVLLCGSGACTFAFVPDDTDADNIAKMLKDSGYWATTTSLANVSARIIESID